MKHLSPEQWRRIEAILDDALELPPAERPALLDAACAGDAALRAQVEALLAADEDAGTFLEVPAGAFAAALIHEHCPGPPRQVGPYRIVRELGSGGMGTVYLAERAVGDERAQFEQQVALKVIKRGMDTDLVMRRFLLERQILARLQHPHIARLLDGGITDDGLPYFAMEYVDGVFLPDYCDAHRLGVEARLRLFLDACAAVEYAHRNLVVHRDIKPSNILVTADGQVKLLDFGIAKLLRDDTADAGALTRSTVRVMTPAYAAPEQVRGEPVTTATDVYALGVVLYELLTGHRPPPAAGPGTNERAAPRRPSSVLAQVTQRPREDGTVEVVTPEDVSRARGTTQEKLRRRLRGDLDTILLTALHEEPERRYASAEALMEDLRRHLVNRPVVAHRDALGYRARKFVRRNRVAVGAAAVLVLLLLGYAATVTVQSRRIARERDKAEQVAAFMADLFTSSNPEQGAGAALSARELLDRGAARVDEQLEDQPEIRAHLLDVIGSAYRGLGLYDEALVLLRRAVDLRRTLHGAESLELATSLNNLGELLYYRSDYPAAESLYLAALAIRRRQHGERHEEVAQSLNNLGLLYRRQERFAHAEAYYRDALRIYRETLPTPHWRIATTQHNLAHLLFLQGRLGAADTLYRETLAMWRALYGPEHRNVAITLNNLGDVLRARGDYAGAAPLHEEALRQFRTLVGEETSFVAYTLGNLADVARGLGDARLAESRFIEALSLYRKTLPEGHLHLAVPLVGLGLLYVDRGRPGEAEPLLREALAIREAKLPDGSELLVEARCALGVCLAALGHDAEARGLLRESHPLLVEARGADHPLARQTRQALDRLATASP